MWRDEPGSEQGRKRRRSVGVAVVLGVTVLVAGVHVFRGGRNSSAHLQTGFAHLAAAAAAETERQPHLDRAERSFRGAIGAVSVDPLALIALSLLPDMARELGRPAPASPDLDGLTERAALDHARVLLRRGYPTLTLRWLAQVRRGVSEGGPGASTSAGPEPGLARSENLARVQLFAELWTRARAPSSTPP